MNNEQERMDAFFDWCRKMHIDLGSEEKTALAYEKVAQNN